MTQPLIITLAIFEAGHYTCDYGFTSSPPTHLDNVSGNNKPWREALNDIADEIADAVADHFAVGYMIGIDDD